MPMALDTFGWKFLSAASSPLHKGLSTYNALRLPHIEDSIGLTHEEIKNSLYDSNPREIAPQSVERALNSDIWFSCNSEVFSDKATGRSLLLDNSSWITSVEEISPDHSDEWTWS
uniref:Putative ovule protein n=1 Tax=Solanum chacoense TaxID=4108 RepID=A0A0V0GXP6_SOLCH